jgi:hypothetical protein
VTKHKTPKPLPVSEMEVYSLIKGQTEPTPDVIARLSPQQAVLVIMGMAETRKRERDWAQSSNDSQNAVIHKIMQEKENTSRILDEVTGDLRDIEGRLAFLQHSFDTTSACLTQERAKILMALRFIDGYADACEEGAEERDKFAARVARSCNILLDGDGDKFDDVAVILHHFLLR